MTQREMDAENERREKAAAMAIQKAEEMLKIKDKNGNLVEKKPVVETATDDDNVEEVLSKEIQDIVNEQTQAGWDLALSGVFLCQWTQPQETWCLGTNRRNSSHVWMCLLIRKLFEVGFDLWEFQNGTLHDN